MLMLLESPEMLDVNDECMILVVHTDPGLPRFLTLGVLGGKAVAVQLPSYCQVLHVRQLTRFSGCYT